MTSDTEIPRPMARPVDPFPFPCGIAVERPYVRRTHWPGHAVRLLCGPIRRRRDAMRCDALLSFNPRRTPLSFIHVEAQERSCGVVGSNGYY